MTLIKQSRSRQIVAITEIKDKKSKAPAGGVWSVRSHSKPIHNPDHFTEVRDYIRRHAESGAAVWLEEQRQT